LIRINKMSSNVKFEGWASLSMPYQSLYKDYPVVAPLYPCESENDWKFNNEDKFFMNTLPHAIALCIAYCAACFYGRHLMKHREPFGLQRSLAAWNLFLSVFSFIGAIRTAPFLLNSIVHRGFYHSVCAPAVPHYGHGPEGFWVTIFILSKVPELLDTLFIVLRKKPLIFLHWYHHITVLLFCWHAYATLSSSGLYFVAMNYSVHAIMYFYYFLTAIGYRPKWALLVTVMQLSQMVFGVIVCIASIYYMRSGAKCYVDPDNLKWAVIMYSSYFALFLKFFLERYFMRTSSKKQKKMD